MGFTVKDNSLQALQKRLRHIGPRTLAFKTLLAVLVVNLTIELIVILSVPHLFYRYLKKEAINQSVVDVQSLGVAGNVGFLLFISFQNSDKLLAELEKAGCLTGQLQQEEVLPILGRKPGFMESQRYAGIALLDGKEMFCQEGTQELMATVTKDTDFQRFLEAKPSSTFFLSEIGEEPYLTFVRTAKYDGREYTLLLTMIWSKFFSALDQMMAEGITDVILYYEEGDQIILETKAPTAIDIEPLKTLVQTTHPKTHKEVEREDGIDFLIPCTFEEGPQIAYVFYHRSKVALLGYYKSIFSFVRIVLLVSFLCFDLCIFLIINRRMQKVRELAAQMEKVRQGDYSVRVFADTGDEIETLSLSFNHMAETIRGNIDRIVEQEKREREMQYTVLASEINPHCIYNTLNTIIYLAALKREEDITKVTRALIKILKDRLKIKQYQSFDTVRNEIALNKSYLELQAYMHGEKVQVTWNVPEELLDEKIPKSILQPLIENALLHGIYQKKDEAGQILQGKLTVGIQRKDGHVFMEVGDTGVGMTPEEAERFLSGEVNDGENHIGLRNIRLRLHYLYGDNYHIECDSAPDSGCIIRVFFEEDACFSPQEETPKKE